MTDVLAAERAHLDRARADLHRMREHTRELLDTQHAWGNDEGTSRALAHALALRFDALLDDGTTPLFFGRLDYERDAEVFHVGRRHVSGPDGEPVVVDWRAPVSEPFYRATPADRQGVDLRRRFGFKAGLLTAFEDDRLQGGERSELLVQEIERPRSGPMRDIVATVQPDQDVLVRAPLEQTVCVQGAPGTGKTAVGLHRAAFLLYAHRQRLAQTGVLVVGPNRAFLSYVQEVLPALGEVRVTQVTADDLAPQVRLTGTDTDEQAVLKGDARMAEVLERALWATTVRATEPLVHATGTVRWRVWPDEVRELERAVRARHLPWDVGRKALAGVLAAHLTKQREDAGGSSDDRSVDRLASSKHVKAYVDALWPPTTAKALVSRVLADPPAGLEPLRRDRPRWTLADLPLLDEAQALLSRPAGYAHVVLDEAQDLSAMQLRAVGRRCATGSATVLGDQAQATTPWAPGDWDAVLRHLGKPDGRVEPLTLGYRVPREVLDLANRLLPEIAPDVPAARSLRSVPGSLAVRRTTAVVEDAVAAVLEAAPRGTVAVVGSDRRLLAEVGRALAERAVDAPLLEVTGPATQVCLVPAELVKGLEFDAVVLLEPADLAAVGAHGLRLLYVALTRAVSSLVVLHARDLPEALLR
ncbi:MAG: family ATPase [Frankiales bacterium]|nr:family ATPase [Frankiales bacterium]